MSYVDGDIESGIYYFVVATEHPPHVHEEAEQAVTAGSESGDPLTVEPHEPSNYKRQKWNVVRISHDVYHIETVSSPGNWIGFKKIAKHEPFIISNEKRDISLYFHPRSNGRGEWMLRVQHENPAPMVVAADPLLEQALNSSEPPQIFMDFFDSEVILKGLHMYLRRVEA